RSHDSVVDILGIRVARTEYAAFHQVPTITYMRAKVRIDGVDKSFNSCLGRERDVMRQLDSSEYICCGNANALFTDLQEKLCIVSLIATFLNAASGKSHVG
ncbi:hypothetical protein BGZ58_006419, partial [Dissophora ornata]